ncbi:MAG: disulfide bond formation protein B [Rhodobacteraceae bacterium]|nr:disulfide bond formation protein B [Paracoccaceae bacterium]
MTKNALIFFAASGSAALLAGAFLFQAFGYPPCAMCLWQRWPHVAAIIIGMLALMLTRSPLNRFLPWLGAAAAAVTSGLGLYHTGVERDWWEGPASCTGAGGGLGGLNASDLLSLDGPRLILCDEVSWQLFGLSMASWNMLFSAVLVLVWVLAAKRGQIAAK